MFRADQWSESIGREIEMPEDDCSVLPDDVRIRHLYFLEWVMIDRIAVVLWVAIVKYLRR